MTRADGADFFSLGLLAGNGFTIYDTVYLNYEVLLNGTSLLAGSLLFEPDGNNVLGFTSGGFDELRLTATHGAPAAVAAGAYQALQIDSIETGRAPAPLTRDAAPVPEPASLLMLMLGMATTVGVRWSRWRQGRS